MGTWIDDIREISGTIKTVRIPRNDENSVDNSGSMSVMTQQNGNNTGQLDARQNGQCEERRR